MHKMGIKQLRSTSYHPQTQGALERYHQVLKMMLKTYCLEHEEDWDLGTPLVLFATREVPVETLGVSSFDMIYGHSVRGPLMLLKESWLEDDVPECNMIDYISDFKKRLHSAVECAHKNLKVSQDKMKTWYDHKSEARSLPIGSKVLALLPIQGAPLKGKFQGPYKVLKKLNDLDYVIETPNRRKSQQVCHINMLKPYYDRDGLKESTSVRVVAAESLVTDCNDAAQSQILHDFRLDNSTAFQNIQSEMYGLDGVR
jgi:hypothetical protein